MEYTNDLVVKSNALIEAMSDMSLQQQRFLAFVSASLPVLTEIKDVEMELSVSDFASHFKIDFKNAYSIIEEKATQLQKKIIEFREGKYRIKVGILLKAKYQDDEGRIWIKIDEDILPHIINLKERFTSYRIKDVYQFKSSLTWRIYELLAQYKSIGKREIHIDDLRHSLNLENKYTLIHDFKRYVITPAVSEINKVSDLKIEWKSIKRGRKITGFLFYISKKQTQENSGPVIDLKKGQGKKVEKKLNLGNFSNLDIYHDKTIRELAPEDQRKAIYRALKKVGVHDGPAKKIIEAVIAQELDYKTVIIEKLDILSGNYMNLKKKDASFSAYVVGALYSKFGLKAKN